MSIQQLTLSEKNCHRKSCEAKLQNSVCSADNQGCCYLDFNRIATENVESEVIQQVSNPDDCDDVMTIRMDIPRVLWFWIELRFIPHPIYRRLLPRLPAEMWSLIMEFAGSVLCKNGQPLLATVKGRLSGSLYHRLKVFSKDGLLTIKGSQRQSPAHPMIAKCKLL